MLLSTQLFLLLFIYSLSPNNVDFVLVIKSVSISGLNFSNLYKLLSKISRNQCVVNFTKLDHDGLSKQLKLLYANLIYESFLEVANHFYNQHIFM